MDTETVRLPIGKRKRLDWRDSDSGSDRGEIQPQPQIKRVKRLRKYPECRWSVTDNILHTPEAEVQHALSTGGRGYESEPEVHGDEHVTADQWVCISVEDSTVYFSAESDGNSNWEISQETERTSRSQPGAPSTTEREGSPEEVRTFSRQSCAAITGEIIEAASPSTSSEAVFSFAYLSDSGSDEDIETVRLSIGKRKRPDWRDSDSSSDSGGIQPQPQRKRVKRLRKYPESRWSVTDSLLHTPETEVKHTLSIGDRGYESEPEVHDDEYLTNDEWVGISVQESTVYFSAGSDENSDWEISQETERTSCSKPGAPSTYEREGSPEEVRIFSRQSCAAITAEISEAASPSTSSEAVFSSAYLSDSGSDEDTETVRLSTGTWKRPDWRDSDSSSESGGIQPQPQRKRVKRLRKYPECRWSVTDNILHTPETEVKHTLSIGDRGYESETEVHDDEYVTADEWVGISTQESTVYFSAESDGNSDWEISQETESTSRRQLGAPSTTEREVSPEEVGTFSRQSCAAITAEVGGAASPSTSSEAVPLVAHVSDSSCDEDSEKCPICLETFTEQETATTDACDHFFCTCCLEEWSARTNTCPVDRQVFSAILVRASPGGKVIRTIPPRARGRKNEYDFSLRDVIFCEVCGDRDRQDRMIFCCGCHVCHHLECLTPPLDTMPLEEWFCPECVVISSSFEA
jgi:hypothetical protein